MSINDNEFVIIANGAEASVAASLLAALLAKLGEEEQCSNACSQPKAKAASKAGQRKKIYATDDEIRSAFDAAICNCKAGSSAHEPVMAFGWYNGYEFLGDPRPAMVDIRKDVRIGDGLKMKLGENEVPLFAESCAAMDRIENNAKGATNKVVNTWHRAFCNCFNDIRVKGISYQDWCSLHSKELAGRGLSSWFIPVRTYAACDGLPAVWGKPNSLNRAGVCRSYIRITDIKHLKPYLIPADMCRILNAYNKFIGQDKTYLPCL